MDKTKEYFRHDYSTRQDEKMIRLIFELGWEGYGLFWALVELIYIGKGKIRADYTMLAYELRTNQDKIEKIINAYGLFYVKDGYAKSKCVDGRLAERSGLSEKRAKAANEKWKCKSNAKAMQMHPVCNASIEQNRIEQNRKEGEGNTPTPTLDEVKAECQAKGYPIDGSRFFHHYQSLGWKKGSTPIVDWKSALNLWASTEYAEKRTERPRQEVSNRLQDWEVQDLILKRTEAFHFKNLAGGKCAFCGSLVAKRQICGCPEYSAGMDKIKKDIWAKNGASYAK